LHDENNQQYGRHGGGMPGRLRADLGEDIALSQFDFLIPAAAIRIVRVRRSFRMFVSSSSSLLMTRTFPAGDCARPLHCTDNFP
jgi:hypothetical protein